MKSKSEAHNTLDILHKTVGVFHTLIPDNANELIKGEFLRKAQTAGSIIRPVKAYTPNQNRAESAIREVKRLYRRAMLQSNAPMVLWDHCIELAAMIRSHTALDMYSLLGETPSTKLFGETSDISHLCQFAWYQFVWYIDPVERTLPKTLGRYLGPSNLVGDTMCSKVLTKTGFVIYRSSVFPVTESELNIVVAVLVLHADGNSVCNGRMVLPPGFL